MYIGGVKLKKVLGIILIISISLSCLLISVELNAFNLDLYNKSFKKHSTNTITGKSFKELEDIAKDLTIYLDDNESSEILQPNFNNREILHMEDVKALFKWGKIIRNTSIFLAIVIALYFYIKREKKYARFTFIGLFANWIILIALGLMVYFNFNKYFTIFHHIFFTNDLWLLNPETDLLIQMLPEDFFMNMATRIIVFFLAFITIIQIVLYIIMRINKYSVKNETINKY